MESVLLVVCAQGAEFESSPLTIEKSFPEPPMQQAAWSPPNTKLSADLTSATTILFQQGLVDPRGCEYRDISVGTGSCWNGDGRVLHCHGWVIPSADKESQKFVICWNGLVYPAVTVGEKALSADE
ncbi:MAG TPA: hypothetical protein VGG19_07340 [Tepidisphaeraceae bacterium]|jgi:hypothetical protein